MKIFLFISPFIVLFLLVWFRDSISSPEIIKKRHRIRYLLIMRNSHDPGSSEYRKYNLELEEAKEDYKNLSRNHNLRW